MAQVGCGGILVYDTFCGPMQELPREGQLLAVGAMLNGAGGCAANVAIDLIKQGIPVDIAGCLGKDSSARVLRSILEEHGVDCSHIVYDDELPTSQTVILVVTGQDRRYIHTFGANAAFTVGQIDRDWVRSLQVFYLGGLFLMSAFRTDELVDLFRFCHKHGVVTVADVVIPQNAAVPENLGELLDVVDYFLPNDDEARTLTGLSHPIEQLRAFMQGGANTVIITRGRQGVMVGRGGEYWQAGVYEMDEVVDPSGCGDAFAAGVVSGIVHGWDIQQTIRFASATGASAVRALGTTGGVFTFAQAQEFIAGNHLEIIQGKL